MDSQISPHRQMLRRFEAGLEPANPEAGPVPARVIGYGEMSTTFEILQGQPGTVYKRLPLFQSAAEADQYQDVYHDYVTLLSQAAGIPVIESRLVTIHNRQHQRHVVYLMQPRLPAAAIGDQVIRQAALPQAETLLRRLLSAISGVFRFNQDQNGRLALGLDAQISNWAVMPADPPGEEPRLIFFDTGSPLLRRQGEEQFPAEMYLRSAPSFLAWILRVVYLKDVVERYYHLRLVLIDLLANLFKEERADLVPPLTRLANSLVQERFPGSFAPIQLDELRRYYRQDALIWRLYLGFRRVDQKLHRLGRRYYPYTLPGPIQR